MAEEKQKMTPEQEDQMIESAYQALLNGYLSSNHRKKVEIIDKAYHFAREAHKGIRRRSGEPYIMHPIAVATIVSQEMGLGSTSICSALLHDVVEDTDYTVEDIEMLFGKKIASIVDGLTKISGGKFGEHASAQAENYRKLLLTMGSDIRVVLIKMADRLHNMRTLSSMPAAKQYKIAGETMYIYAPLAHRLGLFAIKTELEDLSFKYEHPREYAEISRKIVESESSRNDLFERFAAPIRERLDRMGLKYEFKARVKSCYSIWKKMSTKHIPFEEVYDLYAARIVFECDDPTLEKRLCWDIYSEISDLYRMHPDRLRDWVATPKSNGYRALHVTVMGPDGTWIEVQIRSRRMDDIDERGFAAHWKYKIGEGEEEGELGAWLKTIKDILENPEPNALDFLDTIKLNLYATEVTVFTPRGETIKLPQGATVLDYAYALHTDLGSHCIGGKVNRRLVPLSEKLHSGDQVEVLTSHSQTPKPEWEKFLVTSKGKTGLHKALQRTRRAVIDQGEKRLNEFLAQNNITSDPATLTRIISTAGVANKDELFRMIGNGEIALSDQLLKRLKPESRGLLGKLIPRQLTRRKKSNATDPVNTRDVYVLRHVDGVPNYHIAACCQPVPGDDVLGYVDKNNQVTVHKVDCPTALRLKSTDGPHLVATKWDESVRQTFRATIEVEGIDRMGMLQDIAQVISTHMAINMRAINVKSEEGVFSGTLELLVSDATEITRLCTRLNKIKGITRAVRIS